MHIRLVYAHQSEQPEMQRHSGSSSSAPRTDDARMVIQSLLEQFASTSLFLLPQGRTGSASVMSFVCHQSGFNVDGGSNGCMRPVLQDLLENYSFVRLLAGANRQGLTLVMQALQRGEQVPCYALDSLQDLWMSLMTFLEAWRVVGAQSGGLPAADKLAAMKQVVASGLLPTIVEASYYAANALRQLAQQVAKQQQQQPRADSHDQSAVEHIAFACIVLYTCIIPLWPSKIMVGPTVAACAEPVCSLVLAVLAMDGSATASGSNNSSTSRDSSGDSSGDSGSQLLKPPLEVDLQQVQVTGVTCAVQLARRLVEDVAGMTLSTAVDDQVAARLGSGSVFKLVLAALAIVTGSLCTEQQQQQQQQLQQQLPQQYHIALLEVLGIPWQQHLAGDEGCLVANPDAPLVAVNLAVHHAMKQAAAHAGAAAAVGTGTGSSCSSSGAASTSSDRPEAVAAAGAPGNNPVYAATLLTVLQYALLQDSPGALVTAACALGQMLIDLQADEAASSAAGLAVVQPVFLELAPALLQTYREGWPDVESRLAIAAGDAGELVLVKRTVAGLPRTLALLFRQGDVRDKVVQLMLQHPSQVCQAIEAAVRAAAQAKAHMAVHIAQNACHIMSRVRTMQPDWAVEGPAARHAFSCVVTCLKAAAAASSCGSKRLVAHQFSGSCAQEAALAVMRAAAPQDQGQQQQVLLLARCLVGASKLTASLLQDTKAGRLAEADASGTDFRSLYHMVCVMLEHRWRLCLALLQALQHGLSSGLQLPGEPATAEQAQQQLLKQHEGLQQQVEQRLQQATQLTDQAARQQDSGSNSRSGGGGEACFDADLAQQLQAFASAVCSHIPMGLLCCNPACSNFSKTSELDLVGGKACVCAKCLTARFCSKGCLEQCWKHQHRPVCRRIAAGHTQQQQQQQL